MSARELLRVKIKEHGGGTRVAAALGCSRPYLYMLMSGPKLPGRDFAAKLEAILGVPRASWDDANSEVPVESRPSEPQAPPASVLDEEPPTHLETGSRFGDALVAQARDAASK